jgi:hypothetical protein
MTVIQLMAGWGIGYCFKKLKKIRCCSKITTENFTYFLGFGFKLGFGYPANNSNGQAVKRRRQLAKFMQTSIQIPKKLDKIFISNY